MRNIRILFQYDGTGYNGWQVQPAGTTIQGLIEKYLGQITSANIDVIAAGRTDAGVHAIGQVACFKTASTLPAEVLLNALNALLPPDIRILEAEDTDDTFHARFSARKKSYIYIVSTERITSPFIYRFAWRSTAKLDEWAMNEALLHLCGTHDFSAFRGSGCGARTTERTIYEASMVDINSPEFMSLRLQGRFIKFRFEGDAFLRHMVRNMVGTVMEIGRGRMRPEDMRTILDSRDRRCAGPTAPARGLFLERIEY
jgi:tRNA pseudouridine38-40 synthase